MSASPAAAGRSRVRSCPATENAEIEKLRPRSHVKQTLQDQRLPEAWASPDRQFLATGERTPIPSLTPFPLERFDLAEYGSGGEDFARFGRL